MKNFVFLAAALPLIAVCLGCGPEATDTSNAVPPPTAEGTQTEIEEAMDSGQIDPETYGKE